MEAIIGAILFALGAAFGSYTTYRMASGRSPIPTGGRSSVVEDVDDTPAPNPRKVRGL